MRRRCSAPRAALQVAVTAVGAAETAAERRNASLEAGLAAVGDVGEWTVLQPASAAELAGQDGPPQQQPQQQQPPVKKQIAVK